MTAYRCKECSNTFRSESVLNFKKYVRCPKCKSTEIIKVSDIKMGEYTRGSFDSQKAFRKAIKNE